MNEELLQIPAELAKITSMANRSLRIVVDSQEDLSDEQMAKMMGFLNKVGWMTFSVRHIEAEDILSLPEIKFEEDEKTPSQRLRGVIYILWEQKGKPGDFEAYYRAQMEKFINFVKEKLI